MKKKLVTGALLCAFGAVAITGGTLAYFTDTDTETNTFTVGSVDIEIVESILHRDMDDATNDEILADSEGYMEYLKTAGEDIVPGQWVLKAPYIKNVGSNAAYVRVNLTLPKELDDHMQIMEYTTAQENGKISKVFYEKDDKGYIVADENGNVTYTWYYLNPLEPKELSYYAPFWQFRIAPSATNADLADFDGDIPNQLVVTAEAIQADGLLEADDADVDGDRDIDVYDAFALYDAQMAKEEPQK